ncbi:MAG TPA: hypothetical protein VN970_08065, partial [Thermoanaerobaculia bacterium]|nr:hypothetical protein [Thermoanaerobaculia bacterium]
MAFHLLLEAAEAGAADTLHPEAAGACPTCDDLLYAAVAAGDPISKLRTTHACIASAYAVV